MIGSAKYNAAIHAFNVTGDWRARLQAIITAMLPEERTEDRLAAIANIQDAIILLGHEQTKLQAVMHLEAFAENTPGSDSASN